MRLATYKYSLIIILNLIGFCCKSQGLFEYYLHQISSNYLNANFDNVKYYIEKGKSKFPDSTIFYVQSSDLNYILKDYQGAVDDIDTVFKMGISDSSLFFNRAIAYHNLKQLNLAANDYQVYLKFKSLDTFANINYGILEFERGNFKKVKQLLLPYINDVSFEFPAKQRYLVSAYRFENEYDSVIWASDLILKLDSNLAEIYAFRAYGHEQLGHEFAACEDYLKALNLGDYELKEYFDSLGCHETLKMNDKNSPYNYPSPPPTEYIIIKQEVNDDN